MQKEDVKNYFNGKGVVDQYTKAVWQVGLWQSEKIIFQNYFNEDTKILELGCGAGRIGINMSLNGYKNIISSDFCENMISSAKEIAQDMFCKIDLRVIDATNIKLEKQSFEGAIFGFNGIMQIPGRQNRKNAFLQIRKILKDNSYFIFTTHCQSNCKRKNFWVEQKKIWENNLQDKNLDEFGDISYQTDFGTLFIHAPSQNEIMQDLKDASFCLEKCLWRSEIAIENEQVREFSDDCLFWVAKAI